MSVYVDDMQMLATVGRITARWSHMWADTEEELLDFAVGKLGMRPEWIQRKSVVHFDLVEARRQTAIRLGAIPLSREQATLNRRALRERNRTNV